MADVSTDTGAAPDATTDRAGALAEAYKRGLLPPDMKAAYEEAANRGLVSKPQSDYAKFGKQQLAAEPMSRLDRFGTGVRDIAEGALQALAHSSPASGADPTGAASAYIASRPDIQAVQAGAARAADAREKDREIGIQASEKASGVTGTDWLRIGGNVAGTLPLAALNPLAAGAASGALTPVTEGDYDTEKAKQLAIGAAAGKVGQVAGNTLAKIAKPAFTAAQKLLMDEGVRLTPGQMAGGLAKTAEDNATSIPITGHAITSARQKTFEDFNRAAWNRVLSPLGEKMPDNVKMGAEAANHVDQKIDDGYAKVWPNVSATADKQFLGDLNGFLARADSELPDAQAKMFKQIVKSQLVQKDLSTGDALKGVDSTLGKEARGYKTDQSHDNRKLGELLDELKGSFRDTVERQNPKFAPEMQKLNEAYANYVRVSKAASALGAHGGVFTPAQLDNAVRAADSSFAKRGFGKGSALLQDLSKAGMEVLPSKVPDSGTPSRAMTGMLASGLVGGYSPLAGAGMMAGMLGGAAPYTDAGMNLLRNFATAAPNTRNMLARLSTQGGQAIAPAAAAGANAVVGQ